MATFTVKFACDNAAFGSVRRVPQGTMGGFRIIRDVMWRDEAARILRDIADRVERGDDVSMHQNIRDINGNIIGTFAMKEGEGHS